MGLEAVKFPDAPVTLIVYIPADAELPALNVRTLEPVVGLAPKAAVTPLGKPDAAKVTLPAKPALPTTETVLETWPP